MENNEFIEFQKLKHENAKEILRLKEQQSERQFKRKYDFVSFLYGLKEKYLEKEEASHIKKMLLYDELRNGNKNTTKELVTETKKLTEE